MNMSVDHLAGLLKDELPVNLHGKAHGLAAYLSKVDEAVGEAMQSQVKAVRRREILELAGKLAVSRSSNEKIGTAELKAGSESIAEAARSIVDAVDRVLSKGIQ